MLVEIPNWCSIKLEYLCRMQTCSHKTHKSFINKTALLKMEVEQKISSESEWKKDLNTFRVKGENRWVSFYLIFMICQTRWDLGFYLYKIWSPASENTSKCLQKGSWAPPTPWSSHRMRLGSRRISALTVKTKTTLITVKCISFHGLTVTRGSISQADSKTDRRARRKARKEGRTHDASPQMSRRKRLLLKWSTCCSSLPLSSVTRHLITYKSILKRLWRGRTNGCWRGGRHSDTWGDANSGGRRGNYLIKGLLQHRNTEVFTRAPQLAAPSDNRQV